MGTFVHGRDAVAAHGGDITASHDGVIQSAVLRQFFGEQRLTRSWGAVHQNVAEHAPVEQQSRQMSHVTNYKKDSSLNN